MLTRAINIAVISDIHLGHKRNKAVNIIKNLDKCFSNNKALAGLDIVFLAGDVFDELLHLDDPAVGHIKLWIARLLRRCHQLKIKVRVLEGTPSHDRKQSILFVTLNEINSKSGDKLCDLKYIDVLDIEHFPEYNLNVLYIPDEWGTNAQDCLDQVKAKLVEKGLAAVDCSIMHGMFGYQVPAGLTHLPHHDEQEYLDLTLGPIFIGHIHKHSTYSRIIAQGSADRLSHNEEEPKGYVRATVDTDLSFTATFIENKDAAIYKTIKIQTDDITDVLMYIDSELKDVPLESNVRIEAHYTNPILSNLSVIKDRWPGYTWASIARGKETKVSDVMIDHKHKYVPVVLDRQTIKPLLLARLQRLSLNPILITTATKSLNEVLLM